VLIGQTKTGISKNGNHYLKLDGKLLVIFRDKKNLKFKVTVDGTFGKHSFKTFELAKVAAFNGVEYLKEKGEW
jgi:hypothetical protein